MDTLFILFILGVWGLMVLGVGRLFESRGRSFAHGVLLALLCSPLLPALAVLIDPKNERRVQSDQIRRGQRKRCPACAEVVQPDAKVCRYCNFAFYAVPVAVPANRPPVEPPPIQVRKPETDDEFYESLGLDDD